MPSIKIYQGDCLAVLKTMPKESVHTIITSPPYWFLRDYQIDGQIGLEETFDEFLQKMVTVFREARRVLHNTGTLFLNIGDSYNSAATRGSFGDQSDHGYTTHGTKKNQIKGLHSKNLIGQPWKLAFALQDDGWILRSDIIWNKTNAMPESTLDRPIRSHEYMFLFSKKPIYYFDMEAIREPWADDRNGDSGQETSKYEDMPGVIKRRDKGMTGGAPSTSGKSKRDVWSIATEPFLAKIDRWKHVPTGAVSYGTLRILSLNCPLYGGLFDLLATLLCGEHSGDQLIHKLRTDGHLALEPLDGFVPIVTLPAWEIGADNLDSLVLRYLRSTTAHNREIHRTDLFLATKLPCMPSAERTSRIRHILASHGLFVLDHDMPENILLAAGFPDNQTIKTVCCIAGKHSSALLSSYAGFSFKSVPVDHFATFPTKLVEPCILSGTSESGCCEKCLTPYARVFEKDGQTEHGGPRKRADAPGAEVSPTSVFRTGVIEQKRFVGWQASCKCKQANIIPCTVMDIFNGSGTTGLVASKWQRNYVGIELNPEYIEIAERRIRDAAPLFNNVEIIC